MSRMFLFDFKRSKFINILLILQIALWVFYISGLVSLINFEKNYTLRYERSFPLKNGATIKFEKMILNNPKEIDKYVEILKLLDDEKIDYGLTRDYYQPDDLIDPAELGINKKYFKKNFRVDEFLDNKIVPIVLNYTSIEKQSKNLEGNISKNEWKTVGEDTPIILGKDFKSEYKIGDVLNYKGKKFHVVGFFKESILFSTYTGTVNYSKLSDENIFFPIENDYDLKRYDFQPITLYFSGDLDQSIKSLTPKLEEITSNFTIDKCSKDLNDFLAQVESKKMVEFIKAFIISILATASIMVTIVYKLISNKNRIGILYAIGYGRKDVIMIICKEFSLLTIISIVLGSIFYIKKGGEVFAFFLNENLTINLLISILVLIILIIISFTLSVREINKITPRELIGGFRE